MLLNIILLVVGFVVLIKGADLFVDGASNIALNFKVSKLLIGLTIVAFGTSAPEFAVSVKGLMSSSFDIVLGNVIGSNILNVLLIIGISAVIHPLVVKNSTVKKELPITLLITALFGVLLSDNLFDKRFLNNFTRGDGVVLILFFLVFIYYLITLMRNKKEDEKDTKAMSLCKALGFTVLGLIAIIIGSNLVVDKSKYLAEAIGISERIISLTIIALGTSLPELVTSIVATKKGEYDIAIGNVVGSNIFNIGIVIGLPVAILGGISSISFSYVDIIVMLVAALMLFIFSKNDYKISRREGVCFLILFIVYYSYVIFS